MAWDTAFNSILRACVRQRPVGSVEFERQEELTGFAARRAVPVYRNKIAPQRGINRSEKLYVLFPRIELKAVAVLHGVQKPRGHTWPDFLKGVCVARLHGRIHRTDHR